MHLRLIEYSVDLRSTAQPGWSFLKALLDTFVLLKLPPGIFPRPNRESSRLAGAVDEMFQRKHESGFPDPAFV